MMGEVGACERLRRLARGKGRHRPSEPGDHSLLRRPCIALSVDFGGNGGAAEPFAIQHHEAAEVQRQVFDARHAMRVEHPLAEGRERRTARVVGIAHFGQCRRDALFDLGLPGRGMDPFGDGGRGAGC